jgi:hypothetical protein
MASRYQSRASMRPADSQARPNWFNSEAWFSWAGQLIASIHHTSLPATSFP